MVALVATILLAPQSAHAISGGQIITANSTSCTGLEQTQKFDANGGQMLNAIAAQIEDVVRRIGELMFEGIVTHPSFKAAINAAAILYIAIYGILLVTGISRPEPFDIVMRLLKLGIFYAVLSPGGWAFFSSYVVDFFIGGMKQLITLYTTIAMGVPANLINPASGPLTALGNTFGLMFSLHFMYMLLAMMFTGPYGFPLFILTVWAITAFIWASIGALLAYVKAIVGLAFLFGVAPIFFSFILFQRTRNLFDGWLSQVIGFALQPVFVFAFLAFFIVLIESNLKEMMKVPVCYNKVILFGWGLAEPQWFRFGLQRPGTTTYEAFEGNWTADGPQGEQAGTGNTGGSTTYPVFPLDIINILMFWLVAMLAMSYTGYVDKMAVEIAGGGLQIGVAANAVAKWFQQRGATPAQLSKKFMVGKGIGYGQHGVGGLAGMGIGGTKWVARKLGGTNVARNVKQLATGKAIQGMEKIFGRTLTGKRPGNIYVHDRKKGLAELNKLEEAVFRREGIPTNMRTYSKAGNGKDEIVMSDVAKDIFSGKVKVKQEEMAGLRDLMTHTNELDKVKAALSDVKKNQATYVAGGDNGKTMNHQRKGLEEARKILSGTDEASKAASKQYLNAKDKYVDDFIKQANDYGTTVDRKAVEMDFNQRLGERLVVGDSFEQAIKFVVNATKKTL